MAASNLDVIRCHRQRLYSPFLVSSDRAPTASRSTQRQAQQSNKQSDIHDLSKEHVARGFSNSAVVDQPRIATAIPPAPPTAIAMRLLSQHRRGFDRTLASATRRAHTQDDRQIVSMHSITDHHEQLNARPVVTQVHTSMS